MGSLSRPGTFSAATPALDADLYITRYARSFALDGRNSTIRILPGPCAFKYAW